MFQAHPEDEIPREGVNSERKKDKMKEEGPLGQKLYTASRIPPERIRLFSKRKGLEGPAKVETKK